MILKITKYGLAAHLGILAASPVALYPFLAAGALGRAILWFSLVGLIWILCEPSFRMGERSSDARARNLSEILHDPFLYFFIVAAAFALIRWCNNGISMAYDVESASWIVKEAAAPILPASAGDAGYMPFVATVAIGVMVLGVRHALG